MFLCVFQGSFNPIHNAHIELAEFVAKNFNFDKLLFIPTFSSPFKDENFEMVGHRLNMTKLAVLENQMFEVSDIEIKRGGVSYTYDTILELYKQNPIEGKISFIIGTDAFVKIEQWKEADKLKKLVNFIVFSREPDFNSNKFSHLKEKGYNYIVCEKQFKDISSSKIRQNIKSGNDIQGLVNERVRGYIKEHGLYKL